ncbi:hypothetical protein Gotur_013146 [Gossypium turneri]
MVTVASGGASIGLINPCNSQQLIKHPSPFLGTKFKLKLSSKASPSIPKMPGVLSLKAQLIDAVRDLFVGVGVGLPCTVMECGDIIYRSTLPKPDGLTLTVLGAILAVGALSYLWAIQVSLLGFSTCLFLLSLRGCLDQLSRRMILFWERSWARVLLVSSIKFPWLIRSLIQRKRVTWW